MIPQIDHREEVRPGQSIQEVVLDGTPCLAFNLRSGDVQEWDKANVASGNSAPNERAEISYETAQSTAKGRSPINVVPGLPEQLYRLNLRFKAGFPPSRWAVFDQFHPPDTWTGKHGFGGISGHGANLDLVDPTDDSGSSFIYRTPLLTDQWYPWDLAVLWRPTPDGYLVLRDRETGRLLVRWTGITMPKDMPYKYIKQGYYRNPTPGEGTVYQTRIDINPVSTQAPAPTPALSSGYNPSPDDIAVIRQALATLVTLPPQIATLQGIANKMLSDVKAVLDKGLGPWPK